MALSIQPRIDQEEAARLYLDGATTPALAEKYGVSPQAVGRALRRAGVTMRPKGGSKRRTSSGQDVQIGELYDGGMSRRQIAGVVGTSEQTVARRLQADRGVTEFRSQNLRPPTIRVPDDPAKLGYLAGLLDGEGNVQLRVRPGRQVGGKLAIYSTTAAVMDWLVANVGGHARWDHKRTERRGWLPIGIWELYRARDVAMLLAALEPLLIVKRDRAGELLDLYRERGVIK